MESKAIQVKTGDIDPVCGMKIFQSMKQLSTRHEGQTYWFCCPGCKREFDANPKLYAAAPKRWESGDNFWSRYLRRIAKSIGEKPQCCH